MKEQPQETKLTWIQTQIIAGKKQMAAVMAERIPATEPELIHQLNIQFHDNSLTYNQLIEWYFFKSGRSLGQLLNGPLLMSFESTEQCDEDCKRELRELRQRVKHVEINGSADDSLVRNIVNDLRALVTDQLSFLSGGLKHYILEHRQVVPLSKDELSARRAKLLRNWREANPELARHKARTASQIASELGPRFWTEERRALLQKYFSIGYTYQQVSQIMAATHDIEVTPNSLQTLVGRSPDLIYLSPVWDEALREKLRRELPEVFEQQGRLRAATIAEMVRRGFTGGTVVGVMNELGLRGRVNWEKEVNLRGRKVLLEDLLLEAMQEHIEFKDIYQAFSDSLKQAGYPEMSESVVRGKRDGLLKSKNTQKQ